MKIAWFCIPAHGHTNPTLGIVKELTSAGHQVYYFSFEMFREKIEQAGATFIGCDGYDFEMEDKENADRVGKDKAFATELLVSSTLALDEMTTEKVGEIKPDLVVSDSVAFWGKLVAMILGKAGRHEAQNSLCLLNDDFRVQPLFVKVYERDAVGHSEDALHHAQDQQTDPPSAGQRISRERNSGYRAERQ